MSECTGSTMYLEAAILVILDVSVFIVDRFVFNQLHTSLR